jgi:hypothetical protein
MKGFTAEHFKEVGLIKLWLESEGFSDDGVPDRIAKIANALLPALIEAEINRRLSEAETLYAASGSNIWATDEWVDCKGKAKSTHRAKLLAVTEIGKKWPWEEKG